jgi:glycosyltransferase involved in cell wall biosynthesis
MRLVLITDTFPPLRTSGAVQLWDLSREFVRQGHALTVVLPSPDQEAPWSLKDVEGVQVLRLKSPRTKDISYIRRAFSELAMPFVMLRQFRKSPLSSDRWDGVVWYAPSIFHGPLASALKSRSNCKGYLIIRDIFPEWAVDMGLMGRGLPYRFFDAIASYQYSVADVIGVQTPGNRGYFETWQQQPGRKLEVLQNWLGKPVHARCSIRVSDTTLAKRKVFVYAGNMGVAQGMDILLDLAEKLHYRTDIGFLFVGRGSEVSRLISVAEERQLNNVLFYDEIHPDEIPDLYSQCSAGIVALDPRHKSHNIPGKFLTYMQNGLPVLANVNAGNDLAQIIRDEQVGYVCESNQSGELLQLTDKLLTQIDTQADDLPNRCRSLFEREFAVDKTVRQIVAALMA